MSNKPKQWGPHASPEGLGKLRTAVATLPDQKYVSVSGPGFRAKKAWDYQEVVTTSEESSSSSVRDELFSIGSDVQFGGHVGKAAPITGRGFHKRKIVGGIQITANRYIGEKSIDLVTREYELTYTSRTGNLGYFRFFQRHGAIDIALVNLYGKEFGLISNPGATSPLLKSDGSRILSTHKVCSLGKNKAGGFAATVLHNTLAGVDGWGFPTSKVDFSTVLFDKDAGFTGAQGRLSVPDNPAGKTSEAVCSVMSAYPGHAIALIAQYPPDPTSYGAAGEELWSTDGYPARKVQFKNCLPRFWFFKTTDYGSSWGTPWRFSGFDTITPALNPKSPGGVNEPFLGWFTHTVLDGGALADDPYPWIDSERIDYTTLSTMIASSPDHYLMFAVVRDRRRYADIGLVQWRSVVFRTADGGVTWVEVETPFSSAASVSPKKGSDDKTFMAEEAVHYSPFVVRKGLVIVKCAKGLQNHVARSLAFIRSEDHGATWEEFTPSGLPSTTSHHIGMFSNAVTPGGKPILMVPAWDGRAYRMYVSKDDGYTWKKIGKIHSPSEFSNMDNGLVSNPENTNVTAGAFGSIRYAPSNPLSPVDPGCPWRVDARFEYGEEV